MGARLVIFVCVADVDQAVERAVGMGAKILMVAQNQFWSDRTALIIDPSGAPASLGFQRTTAKAVASRVTD
jgi:uncharacterized glyoxalase superfamily protein PhnB